jgi:hypothetical protein
VRLTPSIDTTMSPASTRPARPVCRATTLPMPTRPVSTRLPLTAYTGNISEIAMMMCMTEPAVITSIRRG